MYALPPRYTPVLLVFVRTPRPKWTLNGFLARATMTISSRPKGYPTLLLCRAISALCSFAMAPVRDQGFGGGS